MTQLSFLDDQPKETVSWTGARGPALDRLNVFLPRVGRAYASSRNFDFGPENRTNISCLSPWIRHRLILEEEVVRETLARHSLPSAEKFIQEVFWRAYFKGWLEQRPSVWSRYRLDIDQLIDQLDRSSDVRACYEQATGGKTGIDCFDDWAVELVETGYLHNHARMWFASIWIFTLRLPWQLGADFFYRHLLDGDPASNTLSWRWVAGLHTKGKNYIARSSNIEKYTQGRFSPKGLVDDALSLVEEFEHPLQPMHQSSACDDYGSFGLVVTEEDCGVETLPLSEKPSGICGLLATQRRSPLPIGEPAQIFATNALDDTLERAGRHFECPACRSKAEDWASFLVDWAQSLGVKKIVTAWAPVGPVRAKLDEARPVLESANISLAQIMRPYDQACWPHAKRGFFKLREKIPNLIKELGLNRV